jgi:hypothetical protein
VTLPPSVVIKAGTTEKNFRISTTPVSDTVMAEILATSAIGQSRKTLTINPPALKAFTILPKTITRGAVSQGTITLNGQSPEGGTEVPLSSSSVGILLPPVIKVPAGQTSIVFDIQVLPSAQFGQVAVTATHDEIELVRTFRVIR